MKICIAGASGFIGSNLVNYLKKEKHEVSVIRRIDFENDTLGIILEGCECLINLAGVSIDGIWTKRKKRRIYESRVNTTEILVRQMQETGKNIRIYIGVSGVGIYDCYHKHAEDSLFYAGNFLSGVILDWEGALRDLADKQIRIVILRLGNVLGKDGGIMRKVIIPFRLGLGYSIKSQNNLPFIHITDLLNVFNMAITDNTLYGIINVVSPGRVNIGAFYDAIGAALKCNVRINLRPALLKAIMGESSAILTEGQDVVPEVLVKKGFTFKYPEIQEAIKNILINR